MSDITSTMPPAMGLGYRMMRYRLRRYRARQTPVRVVTFRQTDAEVTRRLARLRKQHAQQNGATRE